MCLKFETKVSEHNKISKPLEATIRSCKFPCSPQIFLAIPIGDALWDCQRSFFFLFFSATILSGLYLWTRYSQRLQIECAAWSCGLILHCCLPSNSFCHFFFFFFSATILSGLYLWTRYSQRLQIECDAWSCSLILHCCLPSNSLRYFFFFLISRHNFATILSRP